MQRWTTAGMTIVSATGELDLADVPALRTALDDAAVGWSANAVVDLRQVTFLDCAVLTVLLKLHRTLQARGGCVRLIDPHAPRRRVLTITGLLDVLCICEGLNDALQLEHVGHKAAA